MPRYVKSEKGYEKSFKADWQAVKKGIKKKSLLSGMEKKVPTSIALDPSLILELKKAALSKGIPYQVLMRMFIMDGFERMKKTGS